MLARRPSKRSVGTGRVEPLEAAIGTLPRARLPAITTGLESRPRMGLWDQPRRHAETAVLLVRFHPDRDE